MYRRILLTLSCALFMSVFAAQDYTVSRRISAADGLSNDFVISMAIDGDGYVWVATEAGVNRIAGKTCQTFSRSELTNGRRITSLYWHAESGQMLIGTDRGLVVYRLEDGRVKELTKNDGLIVSSIDDITEAGDKHVWLVYGSGQIQELSLTSFIVSNLELPKVYRNRCAVDDGRGHLYIGHSQHGLSIVSLSDGSVKHFEHQSGNAASLPGNNVRQLIIDDMQRIWVGTDNGLALFLHKTGTFKKVTHPDNNYDENVYDIVQMDDKSLWVASDIGGISILDPEQANSNSSLYYNKTKVTLSSINTRSIVQDEFGNIWVGNHSTGIDFISTQKQKFSLLEYYDTEQKYRPVYAITKDIDNKGVWMAGEDELTLWKNGQLAGRWSGQNKTNRQFTSARCLMADHSGHLWIGVNDQGAFRFDKRTGKIDYVAGIDEGFDVLSFAEDENGRIWIGGEFATYIYQNGAASREETISKTLKAPATYFLPMADNKLFVATLGDGAYVFDLNSKTSKHLSTKEGLPSRKINQVIRDHRQGLWLATDEGLAYLADPAGLTGLKVFGKNQNLRDNHILAIQQDEFGRIWMTTYAGISCYDESTDNFYNYTHLDTHLSGGFSIGAAITDNNGEIYFGSATSACYFNPKNMDDNALLSSPQIITCEAYNPVGSNTEILLLKPDGNGRVYTTYDQNTIRITFTVRDYAQTDLAEYSYMMKGMDDKWYDVGHDHDVVFRGLRPGHYTFILRAKQSSQDWGTAADTRFEIIIKPPFWRTWWAYITYLFIIIFAGTMALRSYKRKLALRNSLELGRRDNLHKQQLNEERLRFFTNITHELRTPLTLIIGPLADLLNDEKLPNAYHKRIDVIHKNAERLKDLINGILEFRKTETQNRKLTVAKGDIGKVVGEICLNFKELNRNPGVNFKYEIANNLPEIYFDSEIVTTVLNNFLSNAIKYTEVGNITTKVWTDYENQLNISVSDTGYGIAPNALDHVFERYYQAKDSHQASGTGIGLALVKALADLHQGKVSVESREGKGSCFTFSISTMNTYPDALHKEDAVTPQKEKDEKTEVSQNGESAAEQPPTLLVVEDNTDIRKYIADTFCEDFNILQAGNGEEGILMAEETIPDIIVSDIMMPKVDGIQLTRQLKEDIRTSHIPIILLTAKNSEVDREEGYDSGADSYLTKPFTAKLLASRIQNLLAARRRLAEHIIANPDILESGLQSSQAPKLGRLDQEFLDKLNHVISDNIMQQDIDLPFVTEKMSMSHSTFYRKIKALTGMTAKEYIRKFRLQHCYRLLQSGDYNVNEAAMMTGFNQMAHFRETFKNEFGILPSEVKKKS